MSDTPDTLIELRSGETETDGIAQVARDIRSMYPPESVPTFQLSEVVARDGRKFVRLLSLAGSLHLMLPRWRKTRQFSRPVLFTLDRTSDPYEYVP